MSIFSSPIEKTAQRVQRLRAELAEAEAEHRTLRGEAIVARLGRCKDDTVRPKGPTGAKPPIYSASDLARQVSYATDADLSRFEKWLDEHEAGAAKGLAG